MKAIVYTKYGPPEVLHQEDIPKPEPGDNEVQIKIHSTTVTAGDWRMRKADPFLARMYNGLFKPKKINVLGFELSGEVEKAGREVTRFKPGDRVFAFAGFNFGAYAEYICLPEKAESKYGLITHKPDNISWDEAAAVPVGGITAVALLKKAGIIKKGKNSSENKKILVYGASGSVGTYVVSIAGIYGAEVTGVCSTSNVEMVRSIGAQQVFDYTRENIPKDEKYDVVINAVGKRPKTRLKGFLKKGGTYLSVHGSIKSDQENLELLRELLESAKLKPVIDRKYTLDQIAEAHHYVQAFHKKGNVIVNIINNSNHQ